MMRFEASFIGWITVSSSPQRRGERRGDAERSWKTPLFLSLRFLWVLHASAVNFGLPFTFGPL
jgi:hypothetical protein